MEDRQGEGPRVEDREQLNKGKEAPGRQKS